MIAARAVAQAFRPVNARAARRTGCPAPP